MRIFKTILIILSIFFIIGTFLPVLQLDIWWVQIFTFPRIQISILLTLLIISWFIFFRFRDKINIIVIALLGIALFYQGFRIYPYTPFSRTQTDIVEMQDSLTTLSAVSSNVYMKNHDYQSLLKLIYQKNPDLVLLLEADEWWADKMDTLQADYPYTVSEPLDNTYGMVLYSKLKLEDAEVRYMMEDSVPSIHAYVHLPSDQKVRLYCLHPKPPVPPESESSVERDAELLLAGRMVKKTEEPAILMGDLNDVAWSYTTRLFLKSSQMLDPRIGRGFYNTFSAEVPLMRWPLDHVFHTEDFQLNRIEVLPYIGSDHFPIYFSLSYQPTETDEQEPLEPTTPKEEDTVEKKIRKGMTKE
ncbi:endonuclease/exonuclease/phosphatase family protein [Catalinimonas niigatensis]|uniref:endonuclease/exonuclease/phosphatase family protein n=1 Tax=Catalinimonas niigatensis TaxID=1397264 RepID=UPI002665806E|nr:endonuclease/exonuclease/phosphatase family protein [Catalinimonas niigatensis]WPP50191.1 endonuclease/exonuclease/phosphatase family protein [Catalinimonas niigatensis]